MKLKITVTFQDRDGRWWTVWDWRVIARRRARVWPGMPESEWRTFIAADADERRHYRFGPAEGRELVPEILVHQLQRAKLEMHPAADRSDLESVSRSAPLP